MNSNNLRISLTELKLGHISLPAMSQPVRTQLAIPDFGENRRVFDLNQSTEIIQKVGKRTAFDFAILGLEFWWVKVNLKHGEWLPWIEKRITYSQDTVRNFMAAAKAFMQRFGIEFDKKPTINQLHQAWEIIGSRPELTQDFEFDVWRNKPKRRHTQAPEQLLDKRIHWLDMGIPMYLDGESYVRDNWPSMSKEQRKSMLDKLDEFIELFQGLRAKLAEFDQTVESVDETNSQQQLVIFEFAKDGSQCQNAFKKVAK